MYKRQRRALDDPDPTPLLPGTLVALTGRFDNRDGLKALLRANGISAVTLVHGRVNYVVATDRAVRFQTQHVRKAIKRGIPVVSEPWLRLCLVLQQQHAAASARAPVGGDDRSARGPRRVPAHWRIARHNPYRMLVLLRGWAAPRPAGARAPRFAARFPSDRRTQ